MKDLTHGSIVSHILTMAPPIVVGMQAGVSLWLLRREFRKRLLPLVP
jgi:hypothetical protein